MDRQERERKIARLVDRVDDWEIASLIDFVKEDLAAFYEKTDDEVIEQAYDDAFADDEERVMSLKSSVDQLVGTEFIEKKFRDQEKS